MKSNEAKGSDRALYLDYRCVVFLQALGSLHCALYIYALQTWNTYVTTMLPSANLTMHPEVTHTHPTMQWCLINTTDDINIHISVPAI